MLDDSFGGHRLSKQRMWVGAVLEPPVPENRDVPLSTLREVCDWRLG